MVGGNYILAWSYCCHGDEGLVIMSELVILPVLAAFAGVLTGVLVILFERR